MFSHLLNRPAKLLSLHQERLRVAFIGSEIARMAKEQGVEEVVFDRGPYKYHGRVKALADSAREGGLKF